MSDQPRQPDDMGSVYRETRERMTVMLRDIAADDSTAPVPACPGWSVKDVIAHLAGVCDDILSGNLAGLASDRWTAAQVHKRRAATLDELLDEWTDAAPQVEALAPMFPGESAAQWVADAASHEHDVRGALGKAGARDSTATLVGVDFMVPGFMASVGSRALLPTLVVRADGREWRSSGGEASATLEAGAFELFRAVTGRRSTDQIRSLQWSGEPDAYLAAFEWGPFRPAARDIIE